VHLVNPLHKVLPDHHSRPTRIVSPTLAHDR
jgi:hypothetical protein